MTYRYSLCAEYDCGVVLCGTCCILSQFMLHRGLLKVTRCRWNKNEGDSNLGPCGHFIPYMVRLYMEQNIGAHYNYRISTRSSSTVVRRFFQSIWNV